MLRERERGEMSAKWLEERWECLLPKLARYGKEEEEEIRKLCEEEVAEWRRRGGERRGKSLQAPLTQTRQRVRQLEVTVENGWINPRTREREHLALKYLTVSSEEWREMRGPREERMRRREEQPLWLGEPEEIVERGRQLLQGQQWAEVVLGIVLNTGRSISEVLKGRGFEPKGAYTLVFERGVRRRDCPPVSMEVPTFARAEQVMSALRGVRGWVEGLEGGEGGREMRKWCGLEVREAAYRHLLGLVPLREGEYDLYQKVKAGVYPCLAVYYYCPEEVDELSYMATIQGHQGVLEAGTEEERERLRRAGMYDEYRVKDGRKGIRLGEAGVEPSLPDTFQKRRAKSQ